MHPSISCRTPWILNRDARCRFWCSPDCSRVRPGRVRSCASCGSDRASANLNSSSYPDPVTERMRTSPRDSAVPAQLDRALLWGPSAPPWAGGDHSEWTRKRRGRRIVQVVPLCWLLTSWDCRRSESSSDRNWAGLGLRNRDWGV